MYVWEGKRNSALAMDMVDMVTGGTQAHDQNYWWFQAFSTRTSNTQHSKSVHGTRKTFLEDMKVLSVWISKATIHLNIWIKSKTFIHPHGHCPITLSSVPTWITKSIIYLKMVLIPITSKPTFWFWIWNVL